MVKPGWNATISPSRHLKVSDGATGKPGQRPSRCHDILEMRGGWDSVTNGATGAVVGEEESDCDGLPPWDPLATGWKCRKTSLDPAGAG
jgi:hypothetical protein